MPLEEVQTVLLEAVDVGVQSRGYAHLVLSVPDLHVRRQQHNADFAQHLSGWHVIVSIMKVMDDSWKMYTVYSDRE